jgi:hypothetical protein
MVDDDGGEFGDSSEEDSLKEFSISFVMAWSVAGLGKMRDVDDVSIVLGLISIDDGFVAVKLFVTVTAVDVDG